MGGTTFQREGKVVATAELFVWTGRAKFESVGKLAGIAESGTPSIAQGVLLQSHLSRQGLQVPRTVFFHSQVTSGGRIELPQLGENDHSLRLAQGFPGLGILAGPLFQIVRNAFADGLAGASTRIVDWPEMPQVIHQE